MYHPALKMSMPPVCERGIGAYYRYPILGGIAMFCFQCQEAAKGTGCTIKGACGKDDETANRMDLHYNHNYYS